MSVSIFQQTRKEFTDWVQKPDGAIDLATVALLIAQEEFPDLQISYYLRMLDEMGREIGSRIIGLKEPELVIYQINHYLFEELHFRGNHGNYYDPNNSYLNMVLDRKLGIPITLSLVYIEIGKRLGIPIQGIGLPGHFMVKFTQPGREIMLDAYNQGQLMTEEECREKVEELYQEEIPFQPEMFNPISNKEFLIRMLNNLKAIYTNTKDFKRALGVVERIVILNPHNPQEIRDRGMLRFALEDFSGAHTDLKLYLKLFPFANDEEEINDYIRNILGQLGRLN